MLGLSSRWFSLWGAGREGSGRGEAGGAGRGGGGSGEGARPGCPGSSGRAAAGGPRLILPGAWPSSAVGSQRPPGPLPLCCRVCPECCWQHQEGQNCSGSHTVRKGDTPVSTCLQMQAPCSGKRSSPSPVSSLKCHQSPGNGQPSSRPSARQSSRETSVPRTVTGVVAECGLWSQTAWVYFN